MQFTVGLEVDGKTDHTAVDADDALIAALKVKMQWPEAQIQYRATREQERDARHPARALKKMR